MTSRSSILVGIALATFLETCYALRASEAYGWDFGPKPTDFSPDSRAPECYSRSSEWDLAFNTITTTTFFTNPFSDDKDWSLLPWPTDQVATVTTNDGHTSNPYKCCGRCKMFWLDVTVAYWPQLGASTDCLVSTRADRNAALHSALGNAMGANPWDLGPNTTAATTKGPGSQPSNGPFPMNITASAKLTGAGGPNATTSVGTDGFTYTYPSIYLEIPQAKAMDACGAVGLGHKNIRRSYHPDEIFSVVPSNVDCWGVFVNIWNDYPELERACSISTHSFNFAHLPCPPQSLRDWAGSQFIYDPVYAYAPMLAPPPDLTDLDPAWSTCTADYGWDPYTALASFPSLIITTSDAPAQSEQPISPSVVDQPASQTAPPPTRVPAGTSPSPATLPRQDPGPKQTELPKMTSSQLADGDPPAVGNAPTDGSRSDNSPGLANSVQGHPSQALSISSNKPLPSQSLDPTKPSPSQVDGDSPAVGSAPTDNSKSYGPEDQANSIQGHSSQAFSNSNHNAVPSQSTESIKHSLSQADGDPPAVGSALTDNSESHKPPGQASSVQGHSSQTDLLGGNDPSPGQSAEATKQSLSQAIVTPPVAPIDPSSAYTFTTLGHTIAVLPPPSHTTQSQAASSAQSSGSSETSSSSGGAPNLAGLIGMPFGLTAPISNDYPESTRTSSSGTETDPSIESNGPPPMTEGGKVIFDGTTLHEGGSVIMSGTPVGVHSGKIIIGTQTLTLDQAVTSYGSSNQVSASGGIVPGSMVASGAGVEPTPEGASDTGLNESAASTANTTNVNSSALTSAGRASASRQIQESGAARRQSVYDGMKCARAVWLWVAMYLWYALI